LVYWCSFVDLVSEAKLYTELKKEGITLISVGHRESLMKYHDLILHIESDGKWNLQEIRH
jgi:putative ATP-binding cassette transporter